MDTLTPSTEAAPSRRGKRPTPPTHLKVYKTAVFKIHNPSQRKRAMLRQAMKLHHLAFEKLLNAFRPDIARLAEMGQRDRDREMLRRAAEIVRPLPLGNGPKQAVQQDAVATIDSHIELRDVMETVGYPTVPPINGQAPDYAAALDRIANAITVEEEATLRDELARAARMGALRPILFLKNRASDGFLLLRNPETGRLFCWLNLHPATSRFAAPVRVSEMIDVRTGDLVSFTSKTGALFPLAFGRAFHGERFLALGLPQSAKLVWRRTRGGAPCDEFELHVTFQYEVPRRQTELWLGIDRGVYNLVAYAVVTDDGSIVATGAISGKGLRHRQRIEERRVAQAQRRGKAPTGAKRRAWADEAVHVAANAIADLAARHNARVVLEDLSALSAVRRQKRTPGTRRGGFNKLLGRVQYEKLKAVLSYKLAERGLPFHPQAHAVRAAGTSQTCPECGHWHRDNRRKEPVADGFKMDVFACVNCGHTADADENAARVIALKGLWLSTLPRKAERRWDRLPDELKFERFLIACAERRGGGPESRDRTFAAPDLARS